MPEVDSQPHADIRVVPTEQDDESALGRLEERIQAAVQAIADLKQERNTLRKELEQAKRRLGVLEKNKSKASTKGAALKAVTSERDALVQDRHNTVSRVEAMLERLKALGLQ